MVDQPNYIPAFRIASPAKAILCGEHAVVYGKDAIAIGIGLHCRGTLLKRPRLGEAAILRIESSVQSQLNIDSKIMNFLLVQHQKHEKYSFDQLQKDIQNEDKFKSSFSHFQRSIHFKLSLLLKRYHMEWTQWTKQCLYDYLLQIESDIPIGKCLGSSAAFNTVLATALLIIFTQFQFPQPIPAQLKQTINEISMQFQAVEHGTPSGIDNYISVHGGVILYNKNKEPRFSNLPNAASNLRKWINIGVIDSCVEKNTKVAVANVRAKCESDAKYRLMIEQIGDIVGKVAKIIEGECDKHSVDQLLRLTSKNHQLLRQLGVSHCKIQEIVAEWEKKGWGAKITGSGMGGCVLLLSPASLDTEGVVLAAIDEKGLQVSAV